jgi:hypothetical protein
MPRRIFQVSSELFWGYQEIIDVYSFSSIEEICKHIQKRMKTFFRHHNLLALAEKVDTVKFHIHAPFQTIYDMLEKTTHTDIIYVCDHCE